MRKLLVAIVTLVVTAYLASCALIEQPGPSPELKFQVTPWEADRGVPLTILVDLINPRGYKGLNIEELSVTAPDGTKYLYNTSIVLPKGIDSFAVTFPSPEWSGSPQIEQKGIYTVILRGHYFAGAPRIGQSLDIGKGPTVTRMVHVARGIALGPVQLQQDTSMLAYRLDIDYPSKGYSIKIQRGEAISIPVRIQSLVDQPVEVKLLLVPAWSVPEFIAYVAPEGYITVKPHEAVSTHVVFNTTQNAHSKAFGFYILGELKLPVGSLKELAVPVDLVIR